MLRYPERGLVSIPAARIWFEPLRPLASAPTTARALTAQQAHDDLLDLADVQGKRIVSTRLRGNVTVCAENAAAVLEVMSRFAIDPKWLAYLPPTMAPTPPHPGSVSRRPWMRWDVQRHGEWAPGHSSRDIGAGTTWQTPIQLSLSSVGGGTLFGALSGASMASVAMLGSTLVPEMTRRGYRPAMSVSSILAGGGLAVLIPPSALGVLLGAMAKVSIAELLLGGILPGLVLAVMYVAYFAARAVVQPELAPPYVAPPPYPLVRS